MENNITLSKLKITIGLIASILAGIWGSIEAYDKISEKIDESVRIKVEEHSGPLMNKKIKSAVDSIMKAKKTSFREALAVEIGVPKSEITHLIGDWYKAEEGLYTVGLHGGGDNGLYYIHIDGDKFRPIPDSSGYYFYDREHIKDRVEY